MSHATLMVHLGGVTRDLLQSKNLCALVSH